MTPRERMIQELKDAYGLNAPKVFSAMLKIPREKFVPRIYRAIAYRDGPVPIGHGQTMSQPYTVAFMTHLLNLKGDEKVLEIGTGSGYQAAVLSLMTKEVYSVEIISSLADKARKRLAKLGFNNVRVKTGSGEGGWKKYAPYDSVLVTAAVIDGVPKDLIDQVKIGGRIVAPVGDKYSQTMTRYTKAKDGSLSKKEYQEYVFVPFVRKGN